MFSPGGPKQGRFLVVGSDAGRQQVRHEPAIEVVADGDFALLSSLFPEPQDALCALVLEVAAAKPGEGADPGPGIGEGTEEVAGLLDGEFGGFAVDHGVFLAPHGGERVERYGMTSHQGIEEVAQGGQVLIFGGAITGQLVKEAAGAAGGDVAKREVLVLAPGEEAANDPGVGAAGMGVRDPGGEELIGGEQGIFPGPQEDGGSAVGYLEGVGRLPACETALEVEGIRAAILSCTVIFPWCESIEAKAIEASSCKTRSAVIFVRASKSPRAILIAEATCGRASRC